MIKMIGKFLRVDYARPWAKNCDTNADAKSIYGSCIGLSVHTIFPQIFKTKPALSLFMKIPPAKTVKLKISSCDVLVSFKSRHGSSTRKWHISFSVHGDWHEAFSVASLPNYHISIVISVDGCTADSVDNLAAYYCLIAVLNLDASSRTCSLRNSLALKTLVSAAD